MPGHFRRVAERLPTLLRSSGAEEKVLHRELSEYGRRRGTDGPYADNLEIDVLIVGAGFGGVYLLHEMRKAGYKTVIYEAGTSFGGMHNDARFLLERLVNAIVRNLALEHLSRTPSHFAMLHGIRLMEMQGARVDSEVPIYELST